MDEHPAAVPVGGCKHTEATFSLGRDWRFSCPPAPKGCGTAGLGVTPREALGAFRNETEVREVARIRGKAGRGERLTHTEERVFAYSPHGTATTCPRVWSVLP